MDAEIIAALCFGILAGWATYRMLRRQGEAVALSSLAAVLYAVGGAAVMAMLGRSDLFAWYSIGLLCGVFFHLILDNSIQRESTWLGDGSSSGSLWGGALTGTTAALGGDRIGTILAAGVVVSGVLVEAVKKISALATVARSRQSRDAKNVDATLESITSDKDAPRVAREPRYANAALFGDVGERLDSKAPLRSGQVARLRLDIGELSRESQVGRTVPFPDDKLPKDEGIELDVMVSSTDFAVWSDDREGPLPDPSVAYCRFYLPGDGSAAKTLKGATYIWFNLRAPERAGSARCRIGYYYKNILVQSQLLVANIGQPGGFAIDTDFTLSDDLTGLNKIPERPRISILTNQNGDGTHQIVLRKPGTPFDPDVEGRTFAVNEKTIGDTVKQLRKALQLRAPTERRRSRDEFIQDLKTFAPIGYDLWSLVPGQHTDMFRPLLKDPASFVVQVSRPTTSGFVFPWSMIYDIPLSKNPAICKLVSTWDGKSPLVSGEMRQCPHCARMKDVLCPFGFWGFRYAIDQLSSSKDPVLSIPAPAAWDFVVGETQYGIDVKALAGHVDKLRMSVVKGFPGAGLKEGKSKTAIRDLLGRDLPIVYFYCHGEGKHDNDPNTYIGVGQNEPIEAKELQGWIQDWLRLEDLVVWDKIRPLVFINACHSLEIYPETLVSYLDAFVGTARAAGVIGTEVKVHQGLAMTVAENFFDSLLAKQLTVEEALRQIRMDFLAHGNLLGLFYTSYCWSELRVTRQ